MLQWQRYQPSKFRLGEEIPLPKLRMILKLAERIIVILPLSCAYFVTHFKRIMTPTIVPERKPGSKER